MEVVFREPDIYEKFEIARDTAKEMKQHIEKFIVTVDEFAEFIDIAADIESKSLFAGYSVIAKSDGTKEYFYKNIPVVLQQNAESS